MKNIQLIACLVLALAACKSSDAAPSGAPCDTGASELEKQLGEANGVGVDLSNDKVQKDIAAAKAKILGKKRALKGCTFESQGGDTVSFSGGASKSIECYMAGGEKGTTEFRRAAMKLDRDKLKLDISGTIAEQGDGDFKRVRMTDCKISAHE